ncbi:hypothetical protein AB1Y20_018570 [Prymnesium parvum]|uniref:Uncharacterized protein n=1 Tax=Prymnesium parvum TaxID=97485 RepID=A0AB34JNL2_PRYPA
MSDKAEPKPALKPEVAPDGVVRIPKTVFTPLADPEPPSRQHTIVRLDGTVDVVTTGVPPNNPAFAPRQAWPGGKIVTNDKLEVQLKFYERKGLPLTDELKAKKAELELSKTHNIWERLGAKRAPKECGGGRVIKLGGKEGAVPAKEGACGEAPRPARPKGGVKVLSGAEGAMVGEKRAPDVSADNGISKQKVS